MKRWPLRRVIGVGGLLSALCLPGAFAGPGDPASGKVIYEKTCSMCHGRAGKGDGPASALLSPKPRNHTDGEYMNKLTDEYLFTVVKEGGASVGKSSLMPAWSAQIKDEDIHNVVAYLR